MIVIAIVVIGSSTVLGLFMIVITIFNNLLSCCKMVMTVLGIRGTIIRKDNQGY